MFRKLVTTVTVAAGSVVALAGQALAGTTWN